MAVPMEQQGTVKVYIEEEKKYTNVIKAHQSQLGAIQLNYTGNKLATASEKGNVVRIFNSYSGNFFNTFVKNVALGFWEFFIFKWELV